MLVSTGGVGKSSLVIVEALAMVSGKPLLGITPAGALRVWYHNGEDPPDELKRRFAGAEQHYKITNTNIGDRRFITSGRTKSIVIVSEKRGEVVVDELAIQEVVATAWENRIDVIIVDPFVSCHRVNENDNAAIERVAKAWSHIAEEANCSVMLVHHTVKPRGDELTVDSGRGASAALAAARTARVINVISKSEAEKANVFEDERRAFFRTDVGKANMAPSPAGQADWFKLVSGAVGNGFPFGDVVGVVKQWHYPTFDPPIITRERIRECQSVVRAGGPWRRDQRSRKEPWVGLPIAAVLKLDLDNKVQKRFVSDFIEEWITSGLLRVVEGRDSRRERRDYVEAGDAVVGCSAAVQEDKDGD